MTGWITRAGLALAAFFAAAHAQEPVVVGAAISETGAQAALAADYRKGLVLWADEVNAAGGLLGRKLELRLLDDASSAARSATLYGALIGEHKAELLVGPFGSAATLVAAGVTERARRVMVNAAGPARTVHRRTPKYLVQALPPYAAYAAGIVRVVADAGCRSVLIAARDDPASTEMAEAARDLAVRTGLQGGETVEGFSPGGDFAPLVAKAKAASTQVWIAFGEPRDAADMVRAFRRAGFAPAAFFASGAADSRFISLVGRDAERTLVLLRYDARFATPANAAFVKAYTARWQSAPGAAAAQGYTAGAVLAEAARRAGTLEQERLRVALHALEMDTVLGPFRVNPETGEQTGMQPALAQIAKGRTQIVWPPQLKTAEPNLSCR